MTETRSGLSRFRHEHPVFFWGMATLMVLFLAATAVVAARVPQYRSEAREIDARMSAAERATRDRILQSRAARSEMAVALLRRELRVRGMQQKGLHLALSTEDSTLSLRHGSATLRAVPVRIGPDSVVRAPDGRTWRFVRGLGERTVRDKEASPVYTVPEWVYVSRGEPVPPEEARRVENGLGRYVLRLNDGTEIYSQPQAGPLAEGVKPASFMVAEADLSAIFDAVDEETLVFIY
ncbi:MAG TPA: hypothetical protein VHG51_00740 [Longimicrobiaceae bacterium]|nr:hypothetical protein [Longimicrobiaceae bacterium]